LKRGGTKRFLAVPILIGGQPRGVIKMLIRIGEVLNGPLAFVLRLFGLIPFAAISFLIGALVSRFRWIAVSKISGVDPEFIFAAERY
jgi:hypothetical protein